MHLSDVWFIAIATLWAGYFVLEGFDFGVGILLPVLGRNDTERRVLINTIGPVWDGNEVWLITAGGATFAAFPAWYASMFSAFYLPLLLVLVALIIRGVAFEYRGKGDSPRWRGGWDAAIFFGSLLPAIVWGVAFGNIVRGIKLNAAHNYVGSFFDLLNIYAVLGGLTTLALFVTHGAVFLSLKTTGGIRIRARALASRAGPVTVLLAAGFLSWTIASYGDIASGAVAGLAAAALAVGVGAVRAGRERTAFAGTAVAIAAATAALFAALYPDVLPSSISSAYSLTTANASATAKTLAIMTVIAVIFLPLVLLYQGWTYWVFRRRIGTADIPTATAAVSPAGPPPAPAGPAAATDPPRGNDGEGGVRGGRPGTPGETTTAR